MKYWFSGLSSRVKTWKLEYNIEIGGHTKKNDENIKKSKISEIQGKIEKISIDYFTRKKNERWSNWNFQYN